MKNFTFSLDHSDERPGIVAHDVNGLTLDDYHFDKLSAEALRLESITNLTIENSKPELSDRKAENINSTTKISS